MRKIISYSLLILLSIFSPSNAGIQEEPPIDLKPFEKYCKEYFRINKEYDNFSESILYRTKEFLAINKETKEFSGKKPYEIFPIYSYGIEGVAYYEVWLTADDENPEGWILLSRTDKDYPLVNFSHTGIPYSIKVIDQAQKQGVNIDSQCRVYRFGVSYFTLEDKEGRKIAEFGEMPRFLPMDVEIGNGGKGDSETEASIKKNEKDSIELLENVHYKSIDNYDELIKYFSKSYFNAKRAKYSKDMLERLFPKKQHGEAYYYIKSTDQYIYRWIAGTQCLYTQIPANSSYNYTNC